MAQTVPLVGAAAPGGRLDGGRLRLEAADIVDDWRQFVDSRSAPRGEGYGGDDGRRLHAERAADLGQHSRCGDGCRRSSHGHGRRSYRRQPRQRRRHLQRLRYGQGRQIGGEPCDRDRPTCGNGLAKRLPEGRSRAVQQHPRRRAGHLHRTGDLDGVESVQVLEHEGGAVARREAPESRLNGARHLGGGEAVRGRGKLAGRFKRRRRPHGSPPQMVVARVHGNSVEPGLRVAQALLVGGMGESPQEDLLRDIGGVVAVVDDARGQVVDAGVGVRPEALEPLGSGSARPAVRAFDVGGLLGLHPVPLGARFMCAHPVLPSSCE